MKKERGIVMKKLIAVVLVVLTVFSVSMLFAAADENGTKVLVTITDKDGKLALAAQEVQVTDIDGDNALTINDALYNAHEQFYDGGAADGYGTLMTQYGLSLTKLWGHANKFNYGYMVNDVSAWSLTDPVKEGDYIAAYNYVDSENTSDRYSYFDRVSEKKLPGEITLTLKKLDYDQEWNTLILPIEGAVITVDGEPIQAVTDEDGNVTFTITALGKHLVSATCADALIVPPVYRVEIVETLPTEAPTEEPTAAPTQEGTEAPTEDVTQAPTEEATEDATVAATEETLPATKDQATKDQATKDQKNTTSPKTGDSTNTVLWIVITLLSLCGICCVAVIYKKRYEK